MGLPQPRPGQPLWTAEDRAIVLAWHTYNESLCSMCGNPRDICHDPNLTGQVHGEIHVCHITAAVERTRKREWDRFKGQASADVEVDTDGAYVAVFRRPPNTEEAT